MDMSVAKRVLRQYDLRILPVGLDMPCVESFPDPQMSMIMYLFSALDRGNVSNAKSDGME